MHIIFTTVTIWITLVSGGFFVTGESPETGIGQHLWPQGSTVEQEAESEEERGPAADPWG